MHPSVPRSRGVSSRWAATAVAVALALAAPACSHPTAPPPAKPAPKAPPVPPLCAVETSAGFDKPPRERVYPAQNWFVLMLHAYRSVGELARPLNDCSGRPVRMGVDGCGGEPLPDLVPTELGPDDLVVTPLGDDRRLVWVITEHLSDGQGQGPVALASVEPHGLAVRALGVLRAYREHVSLRLETVSGQQVLVADGERCASPNAAETCERAVRVVPLVGQWFLSAPLVDAQGVCQGSTLFPVRTHGETGKGHGATFELEAATNFGQGVMQVREQLAISRGGHGRAAKDRDASGESYIARTQLERTITVKNGRLVTDGPSLLARWLKQQERAPSE